MFRAKIHTFFFLVSPIFRTLDFVYYGHKVEGNKNKTPQMKGRKDYEVRKGYDD